MDLITRQFFRNFINDIGLSGGESDKNFEKFVNYILLTTKNIGNFDLSSTIVGDGNDCGIDGFAISINNRFVNNMVELEQIISMNFELEVCIFYIQTKMSSSFDGSEMLTFGNGIVDTLRDKNQAQKLRNSKISDKCDMIQKIVENYQIFTKGVRCEMYYVTTGKWVDDPNLLGDKTAIENMVNNVSFFSVEPVLHTLGSNEIRKMYGLTKVQNHAKFNFKDKIELPYIETIDESYLGIMPVTEYLSLIADEERRIKAGIFELNVRDFQGLEDNRVNQDIENTIQSDKKSYFGFYNNGITIVGKSLTKLHGKFHIKNFYVVNGCQTSNVLNELYASLDDKMWISVKIVITSNDNLIQDIVRATNNQTVVESIQFQSFDEYQAVLESYFECQDTYKLYYERRKGQYNTFENISINQIITPTITIRAFSSVFLDTPHKATRFIGSLEEEIGDKIFLPNHNPIIYYASSVAYMILDNYIINDNLEELYHKFRFFILSLICRSVLKEHKRPQFTSKDMDGYCKVLIENLLDENKFEGLIEEAKRIINEVVTDLKSTETTKSSSIYQAMLMYQDLKISKETLSIIPNYLRSMDYYLIPFKAMRVDGDLRYNFEDRAEDLSDRLKDYGLNTISEEVQAISNIDDRNREERRVAASKIVAVVERNYNYNTSLLDKAKRYIN